MEGLLWLGFVLSIVVILVISRWHLAVSLFTACLVLAVFTMGPGLFGELGLGVFTDPAVVFLAIAVGLIPIIGGVMEDSGQMESLVSNLRIRRRAFLGIAPALVGMLPMPGGALLSAPLVKRGGVGVSAEAKVALNVWFRHVLYLIYPLSTALIVSTHLAGLYIYEIIPYLFPFFVLTVVLGYLFLLREGSGSITGPGAVSYRGLFIPLGVLMAAPIIDFVILKGLQPSVREAALLVGVGISFLLSLYFGRLEWKRFLRVSMRMKPWNFALIIFGVFFFLEVFTASGLPSLIAALDLPMMVLCVFFGFLLGVVTGRIQVPASIIIPIYLGGAGVSVMEPWPFALAYISIFIGYVISPVHPCISVSLEYFNVPLKDFLKKVLVPGAVTILVVVLLGFFLF